MEMYSEKNIRVLIAGDQPSILQSICDYLERIGGFEIVGTASDGQNAVELATAHRPDLVLLDLTMPRLGGLAAARQIRQLSRTLKMIIFSGLSGSHLADECRRFGADSFVHKNNLPDSLLLEIDRLFAPGAHTLPRLRPN
jgi:DNA-binding NarL/FixJ family response regulator